MLEAYVRALAQLASILQAAIRAFWLGLPAYDERDVPRFVNRAVPLVVGAEQQTAALTRAFIASQTRNNVVPIDVNKVIGSAVRNGVKPQDVYRRPFVTVWADLKAGKPWQEAVNAGEARAVNQAETDIQLTKRATAQAVQDADPNIFGYRRVALPDACEFCKLLASKGGAYVKRADAAPIHPNCHCSLVPLTEAHRGAVLLPDGTRIRQHRGGPIIEPALPQGVAVHDHGELGAVVYDPDFHFTDENQIAS